MKSPELTVVVVVVVVVVVSVVVVVVVKVVVVVGQLKLCSGCIPHSGLSIKNGDTPSSWYSDVGGTPWFINFSLNFRLKNVGSYVTA
jgi:hypothetical protein